ncbi:lectin-like [Benincasa hispida]|uniref:lectin-like n=1 Tax=Benincasa hispida TaxID=102211 RepID=UPI0019022D3B|nr:lectin-like [Benincasa hispida]
MELRNISLIRTQTVTGTFYMQELLNCLDSRSPYWRWINITESGQTYEVAECIQVSWFDIRVKVSATFFTPRIVYDVIWKIQLTNNASGWELPVNIELMRPNGCKIERKQSLQFVKRGDWLEISGGDFLVDNCGCENGGEIELHMYEHGGHWKRGFLLKGVEFRPRGSDCA